jgi:hypothetical protein
MTEDNRRANIEAEWRRVETSLAAARLLLASDLHADSVSRACYAVFHAATCLLLTLGLEPRSHRGLVRLFNQHFIGSRGTAAGAARGRRAPRCVKGACAPGGVRRCSTAGSCWRGAGCSG